MPQLLPVLVLIVVAMLLSLVATPVVIAMCRHYGVMDRPNERKVHQYEVPRLGGAAVFIAISIGMLGTTIGVITERLDLTPEQALLVFPLYLGFCGFFFIGFWDDMKSLPAIPRLMAQFVVAALVVLAGGEPLRISSLFGTVMLPDWLGALLAIIWIVGVVNTINWIDGLDGLVAGISGISALAFLVLSLANPGLPNAALSATLCALLVGSLGGFLVFNFHPAKIFMGDGGAFSVGYLLAVTSIIGLFKQAAVISFMLPVLILALPITDTAFAIIRRALSGQPITRPDKGHIHHRILGFMSNWYRSRLPEDERLAIRDRLRINPAHRRTVLALYTFAALFAALAVWMGWEA
jgi:UDP-GlcNAc:undecaprenyl-phosphate GlcNAc-1-phosphate transferase